MASPSYSLRRDAEQDTDYITLIFSTGEVQTITSKQSNFESVRDALFIAHADEDEIRRLANPHLTAGESLRALSERVRFDAGNIFFDGDVIDSSLTKHISRIIEEGGNENKYGALVKFMEKLYTNPSEASIKSLYDFIVRHDITILPDGDFLAYKGVNSDGTSIHAGYGIVDGVVSKHAHLKNEVGSVVEIPRSQVDANQLHGCSTGLHAGSYRYARGFARGLLLTVKINPRDVVSVPEDCAYEKIRTARYLVLETTKHQITETTYGTAAEDDDFEGQDSCEDCDELVEDCVCDEDLDDDDDEDEGEDTDAKILLTWRQENIGRNFIAEPLTDEDIEILRDGEGDGVLLTKQEQDALRYRSEPVKEPLAAWEIELLTATEDIVPLADWELELLLGADETALRADEREQLQAYLRRKIEATEAKPSEAKFLEQLMNEIDGEEEIVLDFLYKAAGSTTIRQVTGFKPLELEAGRYGLLIKGKNVRDEWRSYFYRFMNVITARESGSDGGRHAA